MICFDSITSRFRCKMICFDLSWNSPCDSFTSRFRCKMISFDLLISITIILHSDLWCKMICFDLSWNCYSFTSRFRCEMISFDLLISITIDAKWPYFLVSICFWHWFLIAANLIARFDIQRVRSHRYCSSSIPLVCFVCLFVQGSGQTNSPLEIVYVVCM